MLNELFIGGGAAALSGIVGFLVSKKISSANSELYLAQAKAKASVIESEAHIILERATYRSAEIEKDAQRKYDEAYERVKRDLYDQETKVATMQRDFEQFRHSESEAIRLQRTTIDNARLNLERSENALEKLKEDYRQNGQKIVVHFDYPELIRVSTWDKNEISIQASVSINSDSSTAAKIAVMNTATL